MAKRFIGNVKGVGISKIVREYYLSSSGTQMIDGKWSTSVPTLGNNKYLWFRDKITLTDNTIQTTSTICDVVWEEIYGIYEVGENIEDLRSEIANSFELSPTKNIKANDDLNDYIDFGNWISTSITISKTLKNCPITTGGFSLRVMRGTGGTYRVQEIISASGDRIYRNYTGSTWSGWKDAAISSETIKMFADAGYPIT